MSANIGEYYREWKPKKYVRTYQFLNSLDKIDVTKMGNAYFSQVKINYEDMSYIYRYNNSKNTNYWNDGWYDIFNEESFDNSGWSQVGDGSYSGDGWDVIVAANMGHHGVETIGQSTDNHFWNDALDTVYYTYIKKDFEKWISNDTGCKCVMK